MNTTDAIGKALYDELAQIIGDVVIEWSYVETVVHDMVMHLAIYQDRAYATDSVFHPLHVALSRMKLREKILVAKALAHSVNSPPDYYDRAVQILNLLDGEMTIERNRYVHDIWAIEGESIIRFAPGHRVIKPQSRQRELITGAEKVFTSTVEVRSFFDRLVATRNSLVDLDNELAGLVGAYDEQTPSE